MTHEMNGRVALITGGSRGIGKTVAFAMARQGARLAITARGETDLEGTAAELRSLGADVLALQADSTRSEDITAMVARTAAHFGQIDILLNNAVSSSQSTFGGLSDEEWRHHIDVKLLGYIRCAREAMPHLEKSGRGRIVNVAGMTARIVSDFRMTNGVVNAAVTNFSKNLAQQVGPKGITVNTVHPGYTWTPRLLGMFSRQAELKGISTDEEKAKLLSEIPIGRFIQAEDICNLVMFLCSDGAAAITGQAIAVDGGSGRAISY